MKTDSRFIARVLETAKADTPAMPWARGTRRAAMIARRSTTAEPERKSA